jgi:hypothetical protein
MELGLVIASLIIGTLALLLSLVSVIMIIAKEKSTHTVQMVPVDEEIDRANQEFLNKWASSEEAIKKEQKLYNEELEAEMPEFALTDDDKEVFSL